MGIRNLNRYTYKRCYNFWMISAQCKMQWYWYRDREREYAEVNTKLLDDKIN